MLLGICTPSSDSRSIGLKLEQGSFPFLLLIAFDQAQIAVGRIVSFNLQDFNPINKAHLVIPRIGWTEALSRCEPAAFTGPHLTREMEGDAGGSDRAPMLQSFHIRLTRRRYLTTVCSSCFHNQKCILTQRIAICPLHLVNSRVSPCATGN